VDESAKAEGGSGREGERRALQHHQPVIPMKQEWKVKEKTSMPTLIAFDDDMDLPDDDESLLIKDMSPPPTGMNINMVFTLLPEFRGAERRSLRCASAPRRSCSRSLKSRAST
jgi:hypothetical protein